MNSQESIAISSSEKTVIKLTDCLSSDMGRLCLNELYSDVSFIVEDQSLPAHCLILAARSEYFRAMLYGGMAESQQRQIQLPEVPLEAFKVILGYLYSATMEIFTLDVAAHIKVLRLANQYGLVEVESALSGHLQRNLSVSNVCMILKTARLYNLNELAEKCLKFMDRNGSKLMADDSFQKLSLESLKEILRRDTFVAYESDIFLSVYEWIQHNPSVDRKSVLSLIRLPIIGVEDLVRVVRPTGIVEPEKILDAIDKAIDPENRPYRASVCPDLDVTSYWNKASLVTLDDNEIVIALSYWYIINKISILGLQHPLHNILKCAAEVSSDMSHWDRVGRGTFELSPFWHDIYFTRRAVRFIRIVHPESGCKNVLRDVRLTAMLIDNFP